MSVLQMSLSGAVLILIVLAVRAVGMDRLPKGTFVALWYVALARLLLPVTLQLPASACLLARERIPALGAVMDGAAALAGGMPALPGAADGLKSFSEGLFVLTAVLRVVWALIAAVIAALFLSSWLDCRREFRTALPVENGFAARWLREHPLRRKVEIRQLAGLTTPLTCGVLRPVILMPKDTDWGNERLAEYILCHEYVHIRRFDALGKGLMAAALCVHWFNPLVWVMYVLFNRDLELACDERVIRRFGAEDRKGYALALIRMEERRREFPLFISRFSTRTAERRIRAILRVKKATRVGLAVSCVLVAALFLCGAAWSGMGSVDPALVTSVSVTSGYTRSPVSDHTLAPEQGDELIRLINAYPKTLYPDGDRMAHDNLDVWVRIDRRDGGYYQFHYMYCSGFSWNPLHFGEDDYYSLVTRYDADGTAGPTWKLDYAFDGAFQDWLWDLPLGSP